MTHPGESYRMGSTPPERRSWSTRLTAPQRRDRFNARASVDERQSEACLSPLDNKHRFFCVKVCATVIDNTMTEIERHFSNTYDSNMKDIQELNPSSSRFFGFFVERERRFFSVFKYWTQTSYTVDYKRRNKRWILHRFWTPYQDVFSELFRLCKIALALPVSNAACELFTTHKKWFAFLYNRE